MSSATAPKVDSLRFLRSSVYRFVDYLLDTRLKSFLVFLADQWDRINERILGIETALDSPATEGPGGDIAVEHQECLLPKNSDALGYCPPDYRYIYRIIRILRPDAQDVFYDIGCGKGRIVCAFARRDMKKVVGVELSKSLADLAIRNGERMRRRKAPIEILCADAARADLSEGSIYYMYNPFGADTLRDVVENIRQSLITHPRPIRIVYHNSVHEDVLESCGWLERYTTFLTLRGARVTFWRNAG